MELFIFLKEVFNVLFSNPSLIVFIQTKILALGKKSQFLPVFIQNDYNFFTWHELADTTLRSHIGKTIAN